VLSPVAEQCLTYLVFADGIKDGKEYIEQIKLNLLSNEMYDPKKLFPDVFGEEVKVVDAGTPEADAAEVRGDTEYDYSDVEWISPSDNPDEYEELMKLTAAITSSSSISVDPDEDGWV
jgi:hypothetical protein